VKRCPRCGETKQLLANGRCRTCHADDMRARRRAARVAAMPRDAYERYVTLPAARAGMTEADWIANRAIEAAHEAAARNQQHHDEEAA